MSTYTSGSRQTLVLFPILVNCGSGSSFFRYPLLHILVLVYRKEGEEEKPSWQSLIFVVIDMKQAKTQAGRFNLCLSQDHVVLTDAHVVLYINCDVSRQRCPFFPTCTFSR